MLALLCASNTPSPPPVHDIISGPGTALFDGWPPERYMVETRLTITLASLDRVQALCSRDGKTKLPKGWEYFGCHRGGAIVTFMPSKGDGEHFARIVAHELGHRRGWKVEHPL